MPRCSPPLAGISPGVSGADPLSRPAGSDRISMTHPGSGRQHRRCHQPTPCRGQSASTKVCARRDLCPRSAAGTRLACSPTAAGSCRTSSTEQAPHRRGPRRTRLRTERDHPGRVPGALLVNAPLEARAQPLLSLRPDLHHSPPPGSRTPLAPGETSREFVRFDTGGSRIGRARAALCNPGTPRCISGARAVLRLL